MSYFYRSQDIPRMEGWRGMVGALCIRQAEAAARFSSREFILEFRSFTINALGSEREKSKKLMGLQTCYDFSDHGAFSD